MTREDLEVFTRKKMSELCKGKIKNNLIFWVTFLKFASLKRPSDILETASY